MFEKALYEDVKNNFVTEAGDAIQYGFGVISEDAVTPYIVMHVLDSDGDPQTLCEGQFASGNTFVQWNIYEESTEYAFSIRRQLDLYVSSLRALTLGAKSYKIGNTQHEPSPSANVIDNGLAVDVLAKTLNYEEY